MASPRITLEDNADFRLVNHPVQMKRLSELMKRVHSSLGPSEFIEAVSLAFKEVQTSFSRNVARQRFRAEASFDYFQKAVQMCRELPGLQRSAMVLGCGRGFAGESSEFAASETHEILSADSWTIDMRDVSPPQLRLNSDRLFATLEFADREGRYDLVVSHSLLHFIPDLNAVFKLIRRLLKPVGALVVGHEPNAKFWQCLECQRAVAELRKARRAPGWRGHLRVGPILRRLGRHDSTQKLFDKVNRRLVKHNGFSGPLTRNEITRLVDVHRPEAVPGDFCIGFDGFDVEELTRLYLPGFRLIWVGTSGHLGYTPLSSLSPEWLRREAILADQHPLAGSVFNAYWRRAPTT
jgi:SAM-dependent methyltransferase